MSGLFTVAISYSHAGLCVLPADLKKKRPALHAWGKYRNRLPAEAELLKWFSSPAAMCIVTGGISGNLEILDFDRGACLFEAWAEAVEKRIAGIQGKLVLQRTQNGGMHACYRCEGLVGGNRKLACRKLDGIVCTLIETRGEGGLFLCAPSQGYRIVQGAFTDLPKLTIRERDALIETARELDEKPEQIRRHPSPSSLLTPCFPALPAEEVRDVLRKSGWMLAKTGENEYWRRPGKEFGHSATLKNGVFYVFSSNAAPFESGRAYSSSSVIRLLVCGDAAYLQPQNDVLCNIDAMRSCEFFKRCIDFEARLTEQEIFDMMLNILYFKNGRELISSVFRNESSLSFGHIHDKIQLIREKQYAPVACRNLAYRCSQLGKCRAGFPLYKAVAPYNCQQLSGI